MSAGGTTKGTKDTKFAYIGPGVRGPKNAISFGRHNALGFGANGSRQGRKANS